MSKSKRGKSGGDPGAKWDEGLVNEQLQSVSTDLLATHTVVLFFLCMQEQWRPFVVFLEPAPHAGSSQAVEALVSGVDSGCRRRFLMITKEALLACVSPIANH